MLFALIWEF
uniref:Uncharacterized protein n=1 Tax=Anguilla anguilla TaxID=7936 RepID=A0A0E9U7L7_ANGAN